MCDSWNNLRLKQSSLSFFISFFYSFAVFSSVTPRHDGSTWMVDSGCFHLSLPALSAIFWMDSCLGVFYLNVFVVEFTTMKLKINIKIFHDAVIRFEQSCIYSHMGKIEMCHDQWHVYQIPVCTFYSGTLFWWFL